MRAWAAFGILLLVAGCGGEELVRVTLHKVPMDGSFLHAGASFNTRAKAVEAAGENGLELRTKGKFIPLKDYANAQVRSFAGVCTVWVMKVKVMVNFVMVNGGKCE